MRILNRNLDLNKIGLFFFILVYSGMYYSMFQSLITISYIVLFVCFLRIVLRSKKLVHIDYLFIGGAFVLYSFLSALWSYDYSTTVNQVVILAKSFFVSFILINCLRSRELLEWAFKILMFSSLVFGLLYIYQIDLSMIGAYRLTEFADNDDGLPNLNLVSIPVAFAFVYFLFCYLKDKKYIYIILSIICIVIVFLLGSRKSIISSVLGIFFLSLKVSGKKKMKIILFCFLLILLIPFFIPTDYLDFVLDRLMQLANVNQNLLLDESDLIRKQLLSTGIDYFMQSPLIGHGFYNFSRLFLFEYGSAVYSHNNYVETLVGGGIIGFVLYYLLYYVIIRDLSVRKHDFNIYYILLLFVVIMLFNQTGIVLLHDRYTWIFISLVFCLSSIYKKGSYVV